MKYEIGQQYNKDDSFKKLARLHQSKYRSEILQTDFDEYGNRLKEADAKLGLNFHNGFGIFDAVKERYPKYSKGLYADMLRSEHIPFNIFAPLKENHELAISIFSGFLPIEITEIISIKIEYAPSPASEYLNDRTAFDAFIEYRNKQNKFGIIGVEIKYTEQEYKLKPDSKEERDVLNKDSIYNRLTNKIELYKTEKISELPKDKYRQVWRNHLLGESMLKHSKLNYSEFTSVILYPKGNKHFTKISETYKDFLLKPKSNSFASITFESFFDLIKENVNSKETKSWLNYLKTRYLF